MQLLGGIFQDFLTRKEDYLRALRGFLREIVRVMKNDFSFTTFTRSLMQERSEPAFVQADQPHKVSRPSTALCGSISTVVSYAKDNIGGKKRFFLAVYDCPSNSKLSWTMNIVLYTCILVWDIMQNFCREKINVIIILHGVYQLRLKIHLSLYIIACFFFLSILAGAYGSVYS